MRRVELFGEAKDYMGLRRARYRSFDSFAAGLDDGDHANIKRW
jgi:hypothetical protein